MIRGVYTVTQAMRNNQRKLDSISNNLANINTNGYKKDTVVSKSFAEVMTNVITNENSDQIGKMTLGVGVDEVITDFSHGSIINTDNPLDLGITNSDLAFFSIEVPTAGGNDVEEMYTRDGGFTLNSIGQLTTKDGYLVKGENGPITLNGGTIVITSSGAVIEDDQVIDKILIKEFADSKNLKKYGNNLIKDNGDTESTVFSGQIIQGAIETSNINSITEMVDMINVMRNYEANQKVLRAHDETLEKAVSEVGRL